MFGLMLSRLRRARRLSQAELALRSGVSQRHISFLETGRAKAGEQTALKLGHALALDFNALNLLLESGGMRPRRRAVSWDSPEFALARKAVGLMLAKHEPYPALAMNRAGDIFESNKAFERLLRLTGDEDALWRATCGSRPRNLYDLSLHPRGIRRFLVNPEEVIPHVLRRLEAAAMGDADAARVLERVRRHARATREAAPSPQSVVVESYKIGAHALAFVSVLAHLANPEDVTAQELITELFFPADARTDENLRRLAGTGKTESRG